MLRYESRLGALLAAAGLLLTASISSPAQDKPDTSPRAGTMAERLARATPANAMQESIEVGSVTRSYWLVAPSAKAATPRPLLFVLHGGGTADARVTFRYRFQDIAARDDFVTVHPNGIGAGWNDGRETEFLLARGNAPDDVAFFRAMINRFVSTGLADPRRIYVMGGSNGALMTLRLGCELADQVAAIAVVSGSLPTNFVDRCKPARALPVLMISGTADDLMPFAGGPVAAVSGQNRGTVIGAEPTFQFWRKVNRCDATRTAREDWPDKIADDGTTLSVEDGVNCAATTRLMIVKGGGHSLPGTAERAGDRRLAGLPQATGSVSREVDGANYIWEFVRNFSLAPSASPERTVTEITLPARDGRELKAVLSMPKGSGPFPVLVTVHGGLGDRSYAVLRNVADPTSDSPTVRALNLQNWIIIAPGYRNDWFGAEETDLVDAIRYAAKLPQADPKRVGVFGGSNGGRLTLRAAVLDPKLMKCIGAGSPFLTHPPDFFGDKSQPPWTQLSPGAATWMGATRERLQVAVRMAANRASKTPEQLMLEHSSQAAADKIRARVLLLTSRADEQVPDIMVQGLIDGLARAGNPATVFAVDKSLHGFYWQREGEFGAREGRGTKTDIQRQEEERALAATLGFFTTCFETTKK